MVVTFLPATLEIGVMQERVAWPLICTVQAPQRAMPQPNLVPVISSVSRSTQSRGMSGLTSTDWDLPFNVKLIAMGDLPSEGGYRTTTQGPIGNGQRPLTCGAGNREALPGPPRWLFFNLPIPPVLELAASLANCSLAQFRITVTISPSIVIKRRRAAVLPAGRVVPEIPPLRVLTQDLSRCFTLDQVEVIELGEGFHGVVHFGSGLTLSGQSHALVFEHVLVPGAPPGACRHKCAHGMALGDQRSKAASIAEADHDGAVRVQKFE